MAENDAQLIRQIAEQVLAQLQAQGRATPQDIRPPAGVCTGDYGQFTDRPDLTSKPQLERAVNAVPSTPTPTPAPTPAPLTGIITAAQLEEAVQRDGIARVAADARLTPLAADFVRENPKVVQRVVATDPRKIAGGNGRWLLWIDGHCPVVQKIVASRGERLQVSASAKSDAGLLQAIRDTAAGVRSGVMHGALLFVRDAAKATVAANRCGNLRAIHASCPDAVQRGIADVAANVLVAEYLYTSADRMTAMVDAMLASEPRPTPMLQRELAELTRGG